MKQRQQQLQSLLQQAYTKYPFSLPSNKIPIQYGTAGFRTDASYLSSVMFTVGVLASIRSLSMEGKGVGVMITASHNEAQDNGVKLIDPSGEMMSQEWEPLAVQLANAKNEHELWDQLVSVVKNTLSIDLTREEEQEDNKRGYCVMVGRDTRPSSLEFFEAVRSGAHLLGDVMGWRVNVIDYGLVTTPQLHYMVHFNNLNKKDEENEIQKEPIETYYRNIANAYKAMIREKQDDSSSLKRRVFVDCAYGVGAVGLKGFASELENEFELVAVNDFNPDQDGIHLKLNKNCGAEYVQKQKKAPLNYDSSVTRYMASVDGDADRIVYFYVNQNGEFCLIDGDKIATLLARFIDEHLSASGLDLELGVVQTAYANGASTQYLKQSVKKPANVCCVATGVKHLHHKAKEFDIGVYFEANGHGTVLFSERAKSLIEQTYSTGISDANGQRSINILRAMLDIINPAIGDAFSDLLVCEAILYIYNWSYEQWDQTLYTDYPSVQSKKYIKDHTFRSKMRTTPDETRLEEPKEMQDALDVLVRKSSGRRTFVRASGTEDVIRVYAEAPSQSDAEDLASSVEDVISQFFK